MVVQHVFNGVQAVLPEIRFFIEVIPHLSEMGKSFLAANVHTGLHQDLGFQDLFIQFFLRFATEILTGPIGKLDHFGEVLIGFLRFLCFLGHKAFPFQ